LAAEKCLIENVRIDATENTIGVSGRFGGSLGFLKLSVGPIDGRLHVVAM